MRRNGFTLIELLVVISIIAILASIILTSLQTSQQKGRDARRISDIKEIQLALSLYYNDNGCYPSDIYASAVTCNGVSGPTFSPTYISVVPKDPYANAYSYAPLTGTSGGSSCTSYHLGATLELQNDVPNDTAGVSQAQSTTPDSRNLYVCGTATDFNGQQTSVYDVLP